MNTFKKALAILLFLVGVIGAGYIGLYLGIIAPIISLASAIDAGLITVALVATQVFWFLFQNTMATIWFVVFYIFCGLVWIED